MGRSVPGINNRYVSGTVSQVADDFRSWPALAKVLGPARELPNSAGACLAHLVAAAAGGLVHLPVAVQGVLVVALKLCRHRGELGDGVPAALLAGCRGKGCAFHTLDSAWKVGSPSSLPPESPGPARNLLALKEFQTHPPACCLPWTPGAPTAWGR